MLVCRVSQEKLCWLVMALWGLSHGDSLAPSSCEEEQPSQDRARALRGLRDSSRALVLMLGVIAWANMCRAVPHMRAVRGSARCCWGSTPRGCFHRPGKVISSIYDPILHALLSRVVSGLDCGDQSVDQDRTLVEGLHQS